MLNLDTHIVVKLLAGGLTPVEAELINRERLSFSCIVLWEIAMLHKLGRTNLPASDPHLAALIRRSVIWNIDLPIATQSAQLDFRSDPADVIISATSIVHRIPLLTRDAKIRSSTMVPLAN
jgi:PIN domain nuclease of toxin-antitoxin system